MAGDQIMDPDLARRLVLHEARAQQTATRELRDLGDGWLFHDPADSEPFWNRVIAPRWPLDGRAFDHRLDEIITLFAALGRLPHVRPLPVGGSPPDLADRLGAAGFTTLGTDRRMVLTSPQLVAARLRAAADRVAAAFHGSQLGVARLSAGADRHIGKANGAGLTDSRRAWPERRRVAADAALVLMDAFGVGALRREALEADVLACIARRGCQVILVAIDDEPAAVARRAWTVEGSYLSSIGTRPRFRGAGLGSMVTLLAAADAVEQGSGVVHLSVEADNDPACRLYETLGFALVGDPTPDLLLH